MKSLAITLSVIAMVISAAHAAILHVPGDYLTIQAALVFAETGDTILVAPGTYYEHIVWPSTQGINLVSEYGADSTIIDAFGSLRVITMETDVDSTTVIKGFTIKNGDAVDGGGIYCNGASPMISHNKIIYNSAAYGGGISCHECSPIINDNMITDNVGAGDGGGISCSYFSSPKIIGNIIKNNSASYTSGGGIFIVDSWPEIIGNTVNGNSAVFGGGMYFYKSTPLINYNTVSNNDAEYGDGLCFNQSGGDINYNNIFGNGCGIYKADPGELNAEYNWWGDSTGPYHTTNPGGLGDSVSDYIDFVPWLYTPYGVQEQQFSHCIVTNLQISPNPFRNFTDIRWQITSEVDSRQKSVVSMKIYDATGRLVKDFRPTPYSLRPTQMSWDGTDSSNRKLPSGVYFLKFTTAEFTETRKLLLIR